MGLVWREPAPDRAWRRTPEPQTKSAETFQDIAYLTIPTYRDAKVHSVDVADLAAQARPGNA